MNNDINYFKEKLNQEESKIKKTITNMKQNDSLPIDKFSNVELSNYDNHPADLATHLFEMEHNRGILNHEEQLLSQIDVAKKMIDEGTYGICKVCKKRIDPERLEVLPFADHCISCKTEIEKNNSGPIRFRPIEEEVLGNPFSKETPDKSLNEGMDYLLDVLEMGSSDTPQDTPQDTGGHKNYDYFYTNNSDDGKGIVEKTDIISNEQYKKQLPDK